MAWSRRLFLDLVVVLDRVGFGFVNDLSPAIIRVGGVIETKESNRNCGGAPWIRSRRGRVARDRMGERHVCTGLALGEVHVKGPNNSRSTRQCLVRQRWPFRGDVTSFSRLKFQYIHNNRRSVNNTLAQTKQIKNQIRCNAMKRYRLEC
jgi:hypothetical protein